MGHYVLDRYDAVLLMSLVLLPERDHVVGLHTGRWGAELVNRNNLNIDWIIHTLTLTPIVWGGGHIDHPVFNTNNTHKKYPCILLSSKYKKKILLTNAIKV